MALRRINERTSALYNGQLVDESGNNIELSSLVTFTLTLFDENTGTIINSRGPQQNVKNTNGVTVSSTGAVEWLMDPADNPIIDDHLETEPHIALWEGTYGTGGTKAFKHPFAFRVVNLEKVI